MNDLVVFTSFEVFLIAMYILFITIVGMIALVGWMKESDKRKNAEEQRNDIITANLIDTLQNDGQTNYKDYMKSLEKRIIKEQHNYVRKSKPQSSR